MFLPFSVLLKTVKHSFFAESQINLGLLKPYSAFILSRLSRPYIASLYRRLITASLATLNCAKQAVSVFVTSFSSKEEFVFQETHSWTGVLQKKTNLYRNKNQAIWNHFTKDLIPSERRLYGSDIANSHIVHICWHLRKNRPRRQRKHKRLLSMRKMLCRMPCCTTRRHDATRGNSKPTTRTN